MSNSNSNSNALHTRYTSAATTMAASARGLVLTAACVLLAFFAGVLSAALVLLPSSSSALFGARALAQERPGFISVIQLGYAPLQTWYYGGPPMAVSKCSGDTDATVASLHARFGRGSDLAAAIAVPGGSGYPANSSAYLPLITSLTFHKMASATLASAHYNFWLWAREQGVAVDYAGANTHPDAMVLPSVSFGLRPAGSWASCIDCTPQHSASTAAGFALLEWTNAHARYAPALLAGRPFRGVMLVRNFKDTIRSGAAYHACTTERPPSVLRDMRWARYVGGRQGGMHGQQLLEEELRNLTYQQALQRAPHERRLLMEMDFSADTLHGACSMALLDHPHIKLYKLEQLLLLPNVTAADMGQWLFPTDPMLQGMYAHFLVQAVKSPPLSDNCHAARRNIPSLQRTSEPGVIQSSTRGSFSLLEQQKFNSMFGPAHRLLGYE